MATADEKFTRCPGCQTVFRVTAAQLALRNGQVRCGHCRTVFDGNEKMISLAPPLPGQTGPETDELAQGPATVTLRNSQALELPVADVPPAEREPTFAAPAEGASEDGDDERFADDLRKKARTRKWFYAAAIPVLVVLLAAQALFHFRDALAARWPAAKPTLVRMCETAGCTIRPLHDIAGLAIDASDLQTDPAHKGLLILTATLRNRAAIALRYPELELALTDANDQVVVRRALAPAEYAGGTANIAAGIPPNGEVLVKMFIDASATTQAGYRLYLFYP